MIVRIKGPGRNDRVILKARAAPEPAGGEPKKKSNLWAGAGSEPPLRELLRDGIVGALMEKDKVSARELLHLIWSVRRNISKKYLPLSLRQDGL
ncbi:hypothetical protein [Telmatospirillum siberiense]|uniref:hypothetical protein n=1 Tax=Telmatospirillum siberiense TaxID=382514 RepID=UPI0011AF74D8|nr:hypothetical protein [Telmatospirillum siberiense]